MNNRTIDVIGYADGTWSLRDHGAQSDIEEAGEPLLFQSSSEARQYASDSGWRVVDYDS